MDGLKKPFVELVKGTPTEATSEQEGKQVLRVAGIDATQEYFILTSRWLRVKDIELIDDPIVLVYKADKVAWIKQIDLQFQRAGELLDSWITKNIFDSTNLMKDSNGNLLDFPIRMKGLDSGDFRLRLRHTLATPSGGASTQTGHELVIRSLAFADTCSVLSLCKNGATCQPTGTVAFECHCAQGYSGKYCEVASPCEMMYEGRTGDQICQSVGARCVRNIPVMRCQWDNDQYFHCRALYQANSPGTVPTAPIGDQIANNVSVLDTLPLDEQVFHLKESANNYHRLIIVLVVFLVSILVFAAVLVGSMVIRLRKSKQRLDRSRYENHELASQVKLSTPGGRAPMSRPARTAATSYNNSAFDVE